MSGNLESLKYSRGQLSVIDQLKLPLELEFIDVQSIQDTWSVIRKMQVRGAPLIAIVAVLGLSVEIFRRKAHFSDVEAARTFIVESISYLRTSRPTAVNLFIATDELSALVKSLFEQTGATVASLCDGVIESAEKMWQDDILANKAMGEHGATRILELVSKEKVRVLTICNTGSLATAGFGTALGVVRTIHAKGKLEQVYACETRPYNQGARLTAFEIVQDGLPGTLITDSMASALMAVKGVDCVVVGADRVAANGDSANKIGTYQLAIAAQYHGIPFFVAAPTTTLDLTISSGDKIPIEERPAVELTSIFGQKIAPDGISVWNPAFDVTPSSLIKGIITEIGVAEADIASVDKVIDLPKFLTSKGLSARCAGAALPVSVPSAFVRMSEQDVASFLFEQKKLRTVLVGADSAATADGLDVKEVGDGNLNFVYIVKGSVGALVVKLALPYVRCVGEQWPLSIDRINFENAALVEQRKLSPEHVPEVYFFSAAKALMVMEYIPPPHLILRRAFIQGLRITTFAQHIGVFMAKTLFGTSVLNVETAEFRSRVSQWSKNVSLCALTEQVVFSDPYYAAQYNRHTTPQLDDFVLAIRSDKALKLAVADLKAKFLTNTQALVHGDLHSGSVMVAEGSTYVIDPEFAFYGPMGFDTGAFLANLLLAYFSQFGRHGDTYADWLLQQMQTVFSTFTSEFVQLWTQATRAGALFVPEYLANATEKGAAQIAFMTQLWKDTLGFAGAKMIRRIVGIAHVADLDEISDASIRSTCEKRALLLAREMVLASTPSSTALVSMNELQVLARSYNAAEGDSLRWPTAKSE